MNIKKESVLVSFFACVVYSVLLMNSTAFAQEPVYSDFKNQKICKVNMILDVPKLKPPVFQWAVVDFDPMPIFRKRASHIRGWFQKMIRQETDLKKREENRKRVIANNWDQGFQYVKGNELYLYAVGPGVQNYYNTSITGKFWFVTKTYGDPEPLLCWCIPLELKLGKQIALRLTRANALDLSGIFDEALAREPEAPVIKSNPLHDSMLAALHNANTLYYETEVKHSFKGTEKTCTLKVWLKKPNHARIEYASRGKLFGVLVGDGENFWVYWPEKRPGMTSPAEAEFELTRNKRYERLDATPRMHSIWHLVSKLGCGMMAFQPSYFHKCPFAIDQTIDSVMNQGMEKIGSEEYDLIEVSLMNHQRSRYYWLSRKDRLPRRIKDVIRVADTHANEENWSNVSVNSDIPDTLFAWKPPEGWTEYVEPTLASGLLPMGTPAPDFSFKTLDNEEFRLSGHKGKVVLINFWRVGCPPCRDELPWLEKIYQTYKDKGLMVVGFNSVDDEKYVRDLLDSNNVTYPNILSTSEESKQVQFKQYQKGNMAAVPLNYYIDRQGSVIKASYGYGDEELDLIIKRILEE